ncbi:MAG: hypothetical protein H6617_05220 [Bdellovibrionaceae bacterium]|nr:hypothetical protein [Bdellovibrionales bacterium]MCB9254065.1 hypothetical protein [Pseudobdellovibrionaceae bacterium]
MTVLFHWLFSFSSLPYWAFGVLSLLFASRLTALPRTLRRLEDRFQSRSFLWLFLLSLALQAFFSCALHWPEPRVHDEYSYLLAADTFSKGRLTNPSPALFAPFESFHIFLKPTYMSKYPPAQGMVLALGSLLGAPIVGAWILTALATALLFWALVPLLGGRWAFRAGALAAVHPLLLSWGQSYWGGSAALCGAALVFGSVGRLRAELRPRHAVLFAVGLGILANSRPYEGLLFSIPACLWLLFDVVKRENLWQTLGLKFVLPTSLVLAVVFSWMAYYNYRLTGDWKKLPYQVHAEQYNAVPQFVWMAPIPPKKYDRKDLESLHAGYERWEYESQQSPVNFLKWKAAKFSILFQQLMQPRLLLFGLLFSMLGVVFTLRTLFGMSVLFLIGMLPVTYFNLHYFAPFVVLLFSMVIAGLKDFVEREGRFQGAREVFVSLSFVWLLGPGLVLQAYLYASAERHTDPRFFSWEKLEAPIRAAAGKHILLMPCEPDNCAVVHNEADLSAARILRARDLGDVQNQRLFDLYPDRSKWLLVHEGPGYVAKTLATARPPQNPRL